MAGRKRRNEMLITETVTITLQRVGREKEEEEEDIQLIEIQIRIPPSLHFQHTLLCWCFSWIIIRLLRVLQMTYMRWKYIDNFPAASAIQFRACSAYDPEIVWCGCVSSDRTVSACKWKQFIDWAKQMIIYPEIKANCWISLHQSRLSITCDG